MARSTFYYYLKKNDQADKYAETKSAIKAIFHAHKGRYGYRRVTCQVKKNGLYINHKTVYKLMRELKLKSSVRVKKYRSYKGTSGKIACNVLERNFKADQPFEKWATDITEFKIKDKKLYLSPIIDLFNQEVISYELNDRPHFKGVMDMLEGALKKTNKPEGLVLHSDQGWHYQMAKYQKALKQNGIIQSMSRKGNCLDNAVMENFFGTLKSELFYQKQYTSIQELRNDIHEYIKYFNKERIKLNLNGMSPMEYRAHYKKHNN